MDFALSNPEKNTVPMSKDEKLVQDLIGILLEAQFSKSLRFSREAL